NGGRVINGSKTVGDSKILGSDFGVDIRGSNGIVQNYGTIAATSTDSYAIAIRTSGSNNRGTITNGSRVTSIPFISRLNSLRLNNAVGTVSNFGTIAGKGNFAINLVYGGVVDNGSSIATAAYIAGGATAVEMPNRPGTVVNFGAISGTNDGVDLGSGTVLNTG